MADFANQVLEFVQAVRREWQAEPIAPEGYSNLLPGFQPRYLSHVKAVNPDRSLTLMLLVYLPGDNASVHHASDPSDSIPPDPNGTPEGETVS